MAQTIFTSDLQNFCRNYAVLPPGAVLIDGSPLSKGSQNFAEDLRVQERALFEKLLLFDKVQLSVAGPNVIAPLLCNRMSIRTFEELLEQDALAFVVWEPSPMMSHKDGKVGATFLGRIDRGGPLDIEQRIDDGFMNEIVPGLNSAGERRRRERLAAFHRHNVDIGRESSPTPLGSRIALRCLSAARWWIPDGSMPIPPRGSTSICL
jgi:hypothetical protein